MDITDRLADVAEKLLQKISNIVEGQIDSFETAPVKTGVKLFLWYWVFKTIWRSMVKK